MNMEKILAGAWRDTAVGIALECDFQGHVREVLRDGLGMDPGTMPGQSLLALLDQESKPKALAFLTEVRTQGAAFDWELDLVVRGEPVLLHFAGAVAGDNMLVVGAQSRDEVARLYEQLTEMVNEQVSRVRSLLKDQFQKGQARSHQEEHLLEDMSRLNNELATAQRELAKKTAELERLNEQKNRFLGMAAHDLRTPLAVIQNYATLLQRGTADRLTEREQRFVTLILNNSRFMLKLVNDLLDISSIDAGKLRLERQPTDIHAVVRDGVDLARALAETKQITVNLVVQPDLPSVDVDARRMAQVLDNLISNALKFSPSGSVVDVGLHLAADGVLLSVTDHGPGIPGAELDNLFKPFQRTSVRTTAGEKSTGLGLAIVSKIVHEHGGRITVDSRVGEGSTFNVWLPLDL